MGKDAGCIEDWAEVRIEELPRSGKPTEITAGKQIAHGMAANMPAPGKEYGRATAALYKYCIDKASETRENEMHEIVCRERIQSILLTLSGNNQ